MPSLWDPWSIGGTTSTSGLGALSTNPALLSADHKMLIEVSGRVESKQFSGYQAGVLDPVMSEIAAGLLYRKIGPTQRVGLGLSEAWGSVLIGIEGDYLIWDDGIKKDNNKWGGLRWGFAFPLNQQLIVGLSGSGYLTAVKRYSVGLGLPLAGYFNFFADATYVDPSYWAYTYGLKINAKDFLSLQGQYDTEEKRIQAGISLISSKIMLGYVLQFYHENQYYSHLLSIAYTGFFS